MKARTNPGPPWGLGKGRAFWISGATPAPGAVVGEVVKVGDTERVGETLAEAVGET